MKTLLLTLVIVIYSNTGFSLDIGLIRTIRETNITVNDDVRQDFRSDPMVLLRISGPGSAKITDESLYKAHMSRILTANGVPHEIFSGNFLESFKKGKLNISQLIRPKIVFELYVVATSDGYLRSAKSSIAYVEYLSNGSEKLVPKTLFLKSRFESDKSNEGFQGFVLKALDKDLGRVAKQLNRIQKKRGRKQQISKTMATNSTEYTVDWTDPNKEDSRLLVGISTGYPLLIGGHLVYWGSRRNSILLGLSGSYFNQEYRGGYFEGGWIFDNDGKFRQAFASRVGLINRRSEESSPIVNIVGNKVGTEKLVKDKLELNIGPSYLANYGPFFGSAGLMAIPSHGEFSFNLQFGFLFGGIL